MAVHPADDGSLVVDGAPRRATSTFTLLSILFVVVIVAALGVLAYGLVPGPDASSTTPDDQAVRDEVMGEADQFVLRSNTYGPADLDENNTLPGYADRVREVITPKFAVSFDDSLTLAEQSVAEAGYARDVDLYATGVESVDADQATVLVAGVINGSYPDSSAQAADGDRVEFEPQPFRFEVMLVQSDGGWLVDDFSPLTSELTNPTGEPTETPSSAAPTKPSTKPSTKPPTKPSAPARSPSPTSGRTPSRAPSRTPSSGSGR